MEGGQPDEAKDTAATGGDGPPAPKRQRLPPADTASDGGGGGGESPRLPTSGGGGAASAVAAAGAAAAAALLDPADSPWAKERLPPPREHELEFLVRDPKSFKQGKSILSHVVSLQGGSFRFRLLVFPLGTESTGRPEQLAAFVEALPPEGSEDIRWAFEGVRYQISVIHWRDYRRTATQSDVFTFQRDSSDRGWHRGFVKGIEMTQDSGWLSKDGELCLRASVSVRRPMLHVTGALAASSSRRSTGYVGLKNHGATCYMNCLLQTLFHIGRFRHIVYSIDCPESGEQAPALIGDDPADGGSSGIGDDGPTLPLLIALQNLFYRLQTSEAPVSCRELMRSFGWDTADAFMQHDAQELNRLLCDRLEEQMKGTAMDGAIKRLFEGEMENYIECVDIEYHSTRNETFYDLQLNVRNESGQDLNSLEESLRDFTSEEVLAGDNAYDAGRHGKQKARKGIRFKRFPPVLYIQLKRFMFDAERLDMCKLNCKLEFPRVLDLESFAPGSGRYLLHTVVVHSGGVSSGHYYAFARVSGRWVKFDDEQVTLCSEYAAVEDNYGGEDPVIENYFHLPPHQLHGREPTTSPRIHNAYMLSYVRADLFDEILAPPLLDSVEQNYRRMVARCVREARLADERKRARVEQFMRVEVRLVLERDLMKLEGFWSHHELPCSFRLRMSRDHAGEDLWYEAQDLLDVPRAHLALFVLHQRKTRQTRFKFMPPQHALRQHLAPHSPMNDSHLTVLCVVSRGYCPQTLRLQATSDDEPHDIKQWTDELCLLIVKYFCPTTQKLVTLGCYYAHSQEPIEVMLEENWLFSKLKPFLARKEVAPLPPNPALMCWEEYCHLKPKEVMERVVTNSIDKEGLYSGDIVIWQPKPQLPPAPPPAVTGGGGVADTTAAQLLPNDAAAPGVGQATAGDGALTARPCPLGDEEAPALTVQELATRLASRVQVCVRLHSAQAPWSPESVFADGLWGRSEDHALDGGGTSGKIKAALHRGELAVHEISADIRWPVLALMERAVKAFGLLDPVKNGHSLWLFDRGPPSSVRDPPSCRLEVSSAAAEQGQNRGQDPALIRIGSDRPLHELIPRNNNGGQLCEMHLVLLPRTPSAPSGGMGAWPSAARARVARDASAATNGSTATVAAEEAQRPPRPVAVHFFDRSVREVGAAIFHVPDLDAEDLAPSPDDDDADSDLPPEVEILTTGRPALDPACVLELARQHLQAPGCEALCAKLKAGVRPPAGTCAATNSAPPGEAECGTGGRGAVAPPLRLLDVSRGRILRLYRSPRGRADAGAAREGEGDRGGGGAPEGGHDPERPQQQACLWPARGANFFFASLRVEADTDLEDPPAQPAADGQAAGELVPDEGGVPRPRPLPQQQLVEVFHVEQTTGRSFGHPFLLRVSAGERAKKIAEKLQAKLCVSSAELNHWRLLLSDEGGSRDDLSVRDGEIGAARRVSLNETDEWPLGRSFLPIHDDQPCWDPNGPSFCVERQHPAHLTRSPAPTRLPRHQKPLTIRAR